MPSCSINFKDNPLLFTVIIVVSNFEDTINCNFVTRYTLSLFSFARKALSVSLFLSLHSSLGFCQPLFALDSFSLGLFVRKAFFFGFGGGCFALCFHSQKLNGQNIFVVVFGNRIEHRKTVCIVFEADKLQFMLTSN